MNQVPGIPVLRGRVLQFVIGCKVFHPVPIIIVPDSAFIFLPCLVWCNPLESHLCRSCQADLAPCFLFTFVFSPALLIFCCTFMKHLPRHSGPCCHSVSIGSWWSSRMLLDLLLFLLKGRAFPLFSRRIHLGIFPSQRLRPIHVKNSLNQLPFSQWVMRFAGQVTLGHFQVRCRRNVR